MKYRHEEEEMTPDQHTENILALFAHDFRVKQEDGQKEHGGKLWEKECLSRAREEAMDLVAYLETMEVQRDLIAAIYHSDILLPQEKLVRIFNIIEYGNQEGMPDVD